MLVSAISFMHSLALLLTILKGQGHFGSPSKLPHYYNVLGWFHVTDVWCEKYGGLSRWMARIEKIDLYAKSWWSPKQAPHYPPDFDTIKAPAATCLACKKTSKIIFKEGWTCLNADPLKISSTHPFKNNCPEFFKFSQTVNDKTLEFSDEFFQERTRYTGDITGPLAPPLLTEGDVERMGALGYEVKFKRGIVCPVCKCCSRRIEWRNWICENKECTFTYALNTRLIPASVAMDQSQAKKEKQGYYDDALIVPETVHMGAWTMVRYPLPDENGITIGNVYHLKSSPLINKQPNGPNVMFEQLQQANLGLKKNPSKCPGGQSPSPSPFCSDQS